VPRTWHPAGPQIPTREWHYPEPAFITVISRGNRSAGNGRWEVSGTTLATCQQRDALATAADPRCDLAGSQPVVVGLDPQYPSADASLLDIDNGGDHSILLCRCSTVEEGQDGAAVETCIAQLYSSLAARRLGLAKDRGNGLGAGAGDDGQ